MSGDLVLASGLAVAGILGGAGIVIFGVEKSRRRPLRSSGLFVKWRTWSIIAVFWIMALASPVARGVVVGGLGMAVGLEYSRMMRLDGIDRATVAAAPILGLVILSSGWPMEILVVCLLAVVTIPPVVEGDVPRGTDRMGLTLLGLLFSLIPTACLWLLASRSIGVFFAVLFAVAMSDVAAFAIGSAVGKRPLAPRVSPNKKMAGVAGNLLGALLGVVLAGMVSSLTTSNALILAAIIGLGAVWGDLLESLLKRHAGVKDAGALLPGFGGVLDRVDSLLICAPLALLALRLLEGTP